MSQEKAPAPESPYQPRERLVGDPRRHGPEPWASPGRPSDCLASLAYRISDAPIVVNMLIAERANDPEIGLAYRGDDASEAVLFHMGMTLLALERLQFETLDQIRTASRSDPGQAALLMGLTPLLMELTGRVQMGAGIAQKAHINIWQQHKRPDKG